MADSALDEQDQKVEFLMKKWKIPRREAVRLLERGRDD